MPLLRSSVPLASPSVLSATRRAPSSSPRVTSKVFSLNSQTLPPAIYCLLSLVLIVLFFSLCAIYLIVFTSSAIGRNDRKGSLNFPPVCWYPNIFFFFIINSLIFFFNEKTLEIFKLVDSGLKLESWTVWFCFNCGAQILFSVLCHKPGMKLNLVLEDYIPRVLLHTFLYAVECELDTIAWMVIVVAKLGRISIICV